MDSNIRVIEQRLLGSNTETNIAYYELAGPSSASKPTVGVATGSIFIEVNTGKVYFFNEASGEWVEQFSFQG